MIRCGSSRYLNPRDASIFIPHCKLASQALAVGTGSCASLQLLHQSIVMKSQLLLMFFIIAVASCGAHRLLREEVVSYWEKFLGAGSMPDVLKNLMSPLSAPKVTEYEQIIARGQLLNNFDAATQFCSAAGLLCKDPQGNQHEFEQPLAGCLFSLEYNYGCGGGGVHVGDVPMGTPLDNAKGIWFLENQLLRTDAHLKVPDAVLVQNVLHRSKLLPRSLVQALGGALSPSMQLKLESQLHISPASALASGMKESIQSYCKGGNVVDGMCVQSVEDMADLLVSTLSTKPFELLSGITFLDDTEVVGGEFRVVQVDTIKALEEEQYLSCHSLSFPYQLNYCHSAPKTKVYAVMLDSAARMPSSKASTFKGIVLCHFDTSTWVADHISFQVLGTKPGQTNACHWSPIDSFVFVPK